MTIFLLIRHAQSVANLSGVLAGRLPGIDLSADGRSQSQLLSRELQTFRIDRLYASPLERCMKTVDPYRKESKRKIHLAPAMMEMDYGLWSGEKLKTLSKKTLWRKIQRNPEAVRFPEGESFIDAWSRIERFLKELSRKYPKSTIAICSHGDVIKMAITMSMKAPLNSFQNVVVDPASISIVDWNRSKRTVISANNRVAHKFSRKKKRSVSTLKNRRVLGGGSGG